MTIRLALSRGSSGVVWALLAGFASSRGGAGYQHGSAGEPGGSGDKVPPLCAVDPVTDLLNYRHPPRSGKCAPKASVTMRLWQSMHRPSCRDDTPAPHHDP